jgi:ABC-2 type transport system permease protein
MRIEESATMSSKAITNEPPDDRRGSGMGVPEIAPSRLREDEPTLPRIFGLSGAVLLIFGAMALAFHLAGRTARINPGIALFLMALGLCGLLYHAAFDRDVSFRRLYLVFSLALLAVGAVLSLMPYPKVVGDQLRFGAPCLLLSLFFFLAAHRNEDDPALRNPLELIFGGVGALMAIGGLFFGILRSDILIPVGLVLALVGLLYLAAFISSRGISNDLAYNTALGMVGVGLLVIVIAFLRAFIATGGMDWMVSYGVILVVLGVSYALMGGGLASDSTLLVLLRRELGAFFFSPITYLVLLAYSFVWAWSFYLFLDFLMFPDPRDPPIEPIVQRYFVSFLPVFLQILAVPVMTMNLFSEENRTATLEVLLTAPVTEGQVVFSKFLAALITYMITWAPAGLFLVAIPLAGGNAFDYRPLLSFLVCMLVWSAAWVSMGMFCSSLTKNILVAAILTGAGMMMLTVMYFLARMVTQEKWTTILSHMSYIHVWITSLEGKIVPRQLLFPGSLTVLFLFLTYKVLESRKWR